MNDQSLGSFQLMGDGGVGLEEMDIIDTLPSEYIYTEIFKALDIN
jgi:hypothetical protein